MEPDQVQPRPRHQRGQPLHELQRGHQQVRGAVAPRRLQLDLHLPSGVEPEPAAPATEREQLVVAALAAAQSEVFDRAVRVLPLEGGRVAVPRVR
jgi:hypothetical protein